MKISVFLFAILCAAVQAAPASSDEQTDKSVETADTSATLLPATNPANVIFRTIEATRPATAYAAAAPPARQYILSHHEPVHQQVRVAPLSFFSAPQPVVRFIQQPAPQIITRVTQAAPAPIIPLATPARVAAEPEPYDTNPQYNFDYQINDGESHVFNTHKESRNGDTVTGEYSVMDPDGSLRITRYTAGPDGYNAEVEIRKGAGPVYQHATVEKPAAFIAPAPVPAPAPVTFTAVAPKPVKAEDSGEKSSASFVDANVLNLGSTRFFQAPISASYFANPQPQTYRILTSGQQQYFANPYSIVRTVAAPRPAPVVYAAPKQESRTFPSGTSFTRIVHGDGTTVEY